ncbi:MAG: hypothetical protein SGJ02_10580 [bacterium]|nr:hypothetical protein [bacterium]
MNRNTQEITENTDVIGLNYTEDPRIAESMFLKASDSEINDFFSQLKLLDSPMREQAFVKCCLLGVLSISKINN